MEITVTYELTDEQGQWLNELLEQRKNILGCSEWTIEQLFGAIMTLGASRDIDAKFGIEDRVVKSYIRMTEVEKDGER